MNQAAAAWGGRASTHLLGVHLETEEQAKPARKVVVAIDLTAASETAVLTGVRMVHPPDELHIVHSAETKAVGEMRRLKEQDQLLEHDPDVMRAFVEDICVRAEEWPHATPHFHTRIGAPVEATLQFCVDVEADLLICGTHARHGVARLLKGSIAEQLVREARCPVLVAREKNYGSTRKSERPAPVCPDCATAREESGDEGAWCDVHGREHVGTHTYSGAESRASRPSSFTIPK